jgi:hypothetical protein
LLRAKESCKRRSFTNLRLSKSLKTILPNASNLCLQAKRRPLKSCKSIAKICDSSGRQLRTTDGNASKEERCRSSFPQRHRHETLKDCIGSSTPYWAELPAAQRTGLLGTAEAADGAEGLTSFAASA